MKSRKIGLYIASCRKKNNMTQQQLADALGVTNKAASKWETGLGMPDISILEDLSKVLGVSIDSIIKAEVKSLPETEQPENETEQYVSITAG